MKARLLAAAARYDALQRRERALVAGATVFGIVMAGYTLWVEPAQIGAARLQKQIAQARAEMQTMQDQLAGIKAQLKDPDAANKAALAEVQTRVREVDAALHRYDNTLVPAERVPQLLQSLLARHRGLELVGLQTLPAAALIPPPATEPGKEAKAVHVPGGNIHKHGIEIRVAGSYVDLLGYVAELERLPQKLLWEKMSLKVTGYPKSELTLTVYTLSLDPTWLVV